MLYSAVCTEAEELDQVVAIQGGCVPLAGKRRVYVE
jgi:hypothetical protein